MAKKREKYLVESEIAVRKQQLAETDYKALKHADGVLNDEEYAETRQLRQSLRDEINALEEELATYEDEEGDV